MMRWLGALLGMVGCAAPPPAPVEAPPPVEVGDAGSVVMEPAVARRPPPIAAPKEPRLRPNGGGPLPLFSDDPTVGDDLAPVTLVLFTDYQCPPCAMAMPVVRDVQAELGDAAVRLVHKHFPIRHHVAARPAAEVAVAVHHLGGHDAFDRFVTLLFDRQSQLNAEVLPDWAAEAGIDRGRLAAFANKPYAAEKVDRDIELAKALEVAGVPEIFVNGRPLDAMLQAPPLRAAIEAERAAVEALRRGGTAPDATYRARCEANVAP